MNSSVLQFFGGIIVVAVMTWFANVSDDTGNVMVAAVVLLWLVWSLKAGSNIQTLAKKVGL